MSQTAIKVENLSKIYRLGEIGTGSIGQDVDRWFKTKILGKEDPFLKIGESNDRATKGSSDFVYSLQDINFEINQGDAVGIIGRNGAGKSTLLKILSRVTTPTTGKINIKGRVASLLEVGTGFHPELTGRENIYLNGAILGMRKREIDRKLDEIIDFSGVERYIDTPVKRYSSGMYVRLAFAVAAHLESEILIVDEVLAVGDAEFQKKCLGKMGEVSKGEGRTVLFVSHNLAAVTTLCQRSLVLGNGRLVFNDSTMNAVKFYLQNNNQNQKKYRVNEINYSTDKIIEARLLSDSGSECYSFSFNQNVVLQIFIFIKNAVVGTHLGFTILNNHHQKVFSDVYKLKENQFNQDELGIEIKIPSKVLLSGFYHVDVALFASNIGNYDYVSEACTFEIIDFHSDLSVFNGSDIGNVMVECKWTDLK
jgi:lipopolysaccharide transport system ATP-binding protein